MLERTTVKGDGDMKMSSDQTNGGQGNRDAVRPECLTSTGHAEVKGVETTKTIAGARLVANA